jgi:hypothetical protein
VTTVPVPTVPRCPAAIDGFPQLQCFKRQGHPGEHEAVDLPSRATYRWHDEEPES